MYVHLGITMKAQYESTFVTFQDRPYMLWASGSQGWTVPGMRRVRYYLTSYKLALPDITLVCRRRPTLRFAGGLRLNGKCARATILRLYTFDPPLRKLGIKESGPPGAPPGAKETPHPQAWARVPLRARENFGF